MAEVVRLPRSSWLRSVIASTATASESWEVLQNEICLVIRAYIERHEKQSHVRQILFEHVGREFVDRYFAHVAYDESLLRPPHLLPQLLPAMRARFVADMQHALVAEFGLDASLLCSGRGNGVLSQACASYAQDLHDMLRAGVDAEVREQMERQLSERQHALPAAGANNSASALSPVSTKPAPHHAPRQHAPPLLSAAAMRAEVLGRAVAELMAETDVNHSTALPLSADPLGAAATVTSAHAAASLYGLPAHHSSQLSAHDAIAGAGADTPVGVWARLCTIARGRFLPHSLRAHVWSTTLFRERAAAHHVKLLEERCLIDNVDDASFSPLTALLHRICTNTKAEFFDGGSAHHSSSTTASSSSSSSSAATAATTSVATFKSVAAAAAAASALRTQFGTFGIAHANQSAASPSAARFRWTTAQEPLILAVANRFYLLSGEYSARTLLHAWALVEVFSQARECELAATVASAHDPQLRASAAAASSSSASAASSAASAQRTLAAAFGSPFGAASPLSSALSSSGHGDDDAVDAAAEAEQAKYAAAARASAALAPHLVRLQTMVCALYAHALPSADSMMTQAVRAWHTLLPQRCAHVHTHVTRLHALATAVAQPSAAAVGGSSGATVGGGDSNGGDGKGDLLMSQWLNGTRKGAGGLAAPLQPVVLMQRWIEYAFVGFLPANGVRFVWDQCFVYAQGWQSLLSEFACALMHILEPVLMSARTFDEVDSACVFATRRVPTKMLVEYFQRHVAPTMQ